MSSALLVTRHQSFNRLLHALPHRHPVLNMKFRSFGLSRKTQATPPSPKLLAETAYGIDESIPEANLYRYIRQRWLKNEQEELAKRYLRFDLPQLLKEAVVVCEGAQHCTQVLKCVEGLHNKAFILMMDNGAEIFAKLPNPNPGSACYTTSSEVATRQMLRDVFSIPVPRVLAWSCDGVSNSVQAEYILEEKVPGLRLGAVWFNLPWATKLAIIDQVAQFDASLSANSSRDQLASDRGPWNSPQAYTRALGANEKAWIKKNSKARMNYYRSLKDPELPRDAIELLEKYEQVAPLLVPAPNDESPATNFLWHPDLHLDNVFVDPVSHRIAGIVDWQSAVVSPLFYQCGVHRAFRYYKTVREGWIVPEKPTNFDVLGHEEQKQIETDLESESIHKYYELQTRKRVPLHWDVLQQSSVLVLRKPIWLVTGVWENRDLFFLRDSLIALVSLWDQLFEEDIPCPINFSTEELELHAKEEENMDGVGKMLSLLQDQGVLPADGMVRPDDYSTAVENCRKYREVFLDAAQDEEERDLYSKLWPYQDHST